VHNVKLRSFAFRYAIPTSGQMASNERHMRTLEGTTALITGGSRGIGRAICLRLAGQGADIILHYNRNQVAAEAVAAAIGGEVKLVHANLSFRRRERVTSNTPIENAPNRAPARSLGNHPSGHFR
jgi:shikimate 5-dehydrogenase